MKYNFTDVDSVEVALTVQLRDVARLRATLQEVLDGKDVSVGRWWLRDQVKALAEAQGKVADTLRYESESLATTAKLPEEF
jgi:hypothetical protein